jgi:hypothetical protein
MAAGFIPHDSQSLAMAYSTAKSAGWVMRVCNSFLLGGGGFFRGRIKCGPKIQLKVCMQPVGASIQFQSENRLTLVKLSTHLDLLRALAREHKNDRHIVAHLSPGMCAPGVSVSKAAMAPAVSPPQRIFDTRIHVAGLQAKGNIRQIEIGAFPQVRARLSAVRASASSDLAEKVSNFHRRDGPDGSGPGASSRTTCALVPPTPNELTPARRGCPWAVHSARRSFT